MPPSLRAVVGIVPPLQRWSETGGFRTLGHGEGVEGGARAVPLFDKCW